MIRIEKPAAVAVASNPLVEHDPKEIIATAMLELEFQGRTVDAEAIGEVTHLTEDEIEQNWRAARDLARIRQRSARAA